MPVCGDESLETMELQSNSAYGQVGKFYMVAPSHSYSFDSQTHSHLEVDPALPRVTDIDLRSNLAYEQVS